MSRPRPSECCAAFAAADHRPCALRTIFLTVVSDGSPSPARSKVEIGLLRLWQSAGPPSRPAAKLGIGGMSGIRLPVDGKPFLVARAITYWALVPRHVAP